MEQLSTEEAFELQPIEAAARRLTRREALTDVLVSRTAPMGSDYLLELRATALVNNLPATDNSDLALAYQSNWHHNVYIFDATMREPVFWLPIHRIGQPNFQGAWSPIAVMDALAEADPNEHEELINFAADAVRFIALLDSPGPYNDLLADYVSQEFLKHMEGAAVQTHRTAHQPLIDGRVLQVEVTERFNYEDNPMITTDILKPPLRIRLVDPTLDQAIVLEKTESGEFESSVERARFADELARIVSHDAIEVDEVGNVVIDIEAMHQWRAWLTMERADGMRTVQPAHVAEVRAAFHSLRLS